MSSDISVKIFRLIRKEDMFGGRITKTTFQSILRSRKLLLATSLINEIFLDINDVPSDKEVARRDIITLIKIVVKENDTNELVSKIRNAEKYVREGNLVQAENIIRSVRFTNTDEIKTSEQLMMKSIVKSSGFKTGINLLDKKKLVFKLGDITSIVSDSGAMKTYFAMWFMIMTLIENPKFVGGFFEKEMDIDDIGLRLASFVTQVSTAEILKDSVENGPDAIKQYEKLIKEKTNDTVSDLLKRFKPIPNTHFNTPIDMLRYIEKYDMDIWVLDYMTMITSDNPGLNGQYNLQIQDAAKSVKQITAETKTHGVIINQTGKSTDDARDKRILNPNDMEWSKMIQNISANIYSLFYPWKFKDFFRKADFMKGIKAPEFEKGYYFVHDLKSRHLDSKDVTVFRAVPDESRFEEYDEEGTAKAMRFYNGYVSWLNKRRK